MPLPELVLRVAAFTELGILIPMLLTHSANNRSYRYAALLLLGIACYVLAPLAVYHWHWGLASYPIIFMAILVPAFFWYFACVLFMDDFEARPWTKWLVAATALLGFFNLCTSTAFSDTCQLGELAWPGLVARAAKLLWLVAAFAVVLRDWKGDLIESRIRLRRMIVFLGGCYIVVVLLVELFTQDPVPESLELLNVSLLFVAITGGCLHLLTINTSNVFARMAQPAQPTDTQVSPLAEKMAVLMEQERAYATEGLTIKGLADQLGIQAYQLRRLINGELGYRNFNTFINLYRIKEVAMRLQQREYRDTPLLTLALDAGFRSLAPFNRSFKDHYKVTPSEYRQSLSLSE